MSSTTSSRDDEPREAPTPASASEGASLAELARRPSPAPAAGGPAAPAPRVRVEALEPAPERGVLPRYGIPALAAVVLVLALVARATTNLNAAVLVVAGLLIVTIATNVWSRVVEGRRKAVDRTVTVAVTSAFLLAMVPLVSVLYTVVSRGLTRFDVNFFTVTMRGVVGEGGGALHAISGTLIITAIASVVSIPIGIMAAVYLVEYGHGRLAKALTFFVDVMTGIPSIVAGLFAYALAVVFFGPGIRLGVIGSVALSVLMIPIVVRSTEEMLRIVPNSLREAAYALGTPKWKTITSIVLPTALAGIVTGAMLAVARIVGETAPLLVTTGVLTSLNFNPFSGRMQNLAVFSYNEYSNPGIPPQPFIDRAWAAALTLILIVMVLNIAARLIYRRFGTEIR